MAQMSVDGTERKPLVLLVDDEPHIVEFLRMGFEYEGFEVAVRDGWRGEAPRSRRRRSPNRHPRRDVARIPGWRRRNGCGPSATWRSSC